MSGDDTELLDELSAVHLASIINRVAASFDTAALSPAEVVAVYTLMDRLMDALWNEHKKTLLPLYQALLTRIGFKDEPEEPDDGETH